MSQVASFTEWTTSRTLHAIGTNFKSEPIPFQGWKKFKEAFAPELIYRAVEESTIKVKRILDPFGGSGTTALAAQFLGVHAVTCEINPFLADLIAAILQKYDLPALVSDFAEITSAIRILRFDIGSPESDARENSDRWLPPTFVEPGVNDRWLFSKTLFTFIDRVLAKTSQLDNSDNARLIKVIVGGTLVDLSNARVSGKGRRYRSSWSTREATVDHAANVITGALKSALSDVSKHNVRSCHSFELIRGDARSALENVALVDLCVFSPPYPNSFDYTDVYNIELWMLGYLEDMAQNRSLRSSTLSSHVQIKRDYSAAPSGSPTLKTTLAKLESVRSNLWSADIPDMIGAYFAEMSSILLRTKAVLRASGQAWLVVGDSRYANIEVPVALILQELAESLGYSVVTKEPFRSMRSSPQQGGELDLAETLLVLQKN